MSRLLRILTIGAILLAAGCGASTSSVATAVEVSEPIEAEPASGQLSDFFGPEVLPVDEAASAEPATTPTPEPTEAAPADPTGEPVEDGEPVDDAASDADSEDISVLPISVPSAGAHSFDVTGSGYTTGADVLVVLCVIPGEPMVPSVAPEVLAARLALLDAAQDCAIDEAVSTSADDEGAFRVELTGLIQINSMVYAADVAAGRGAYILVPITP